MAKGEQAVEEQDVRPRAPVRGIDLEMLGGAVGLFREQPEAATVTIRTRHLWDEGFAVNGRAEEIEEGGEVTKRSFRFRTDWPPEIGGRDSGPSPGELLLGALGACVAMTYVTKAATRGIQIDGLEVRIEASVDFRGVFELDSVRAGLSRAKIAVVVESSADDATLEEIAASTRRSSAVYDSIANPVPVDLSVRRRSQGDRT
ncbi:MAG: OsmC family protein [Actinomycetota bacterium]